jgi:hypothetical protein
MRYVLNMTCMPEADVAAIQVASVAAVKSEATVNRMAPYPGAPLSVEVRSDVEGYLRGLVSALESTGWVAGWTIFEDAPVEMPDTSVQMPPVDPTE